MKRNTKRFLSLFLSVPMVLSLTAMPVYATPTDSEVVEGQEDTDAAVPETQEAEDEAAPEQAQEDTADAASGADTVITVEDAFSTFTVDTSKIEAPEINVNEAQLSEQDLAAIDENDPEIATVKDELENIKVLNEDGESVALTEEQIQTVLGMYTQYQQNWIANADVLGVQAPFYLQFNDNGEDGLGVLGEMLTLAGVSVDDVRNGNYTYDNLTGMIMNFLYGDMYGVEFYGDAVKAKRDEALQTVENSGAQTDVQKLLVLNSWLAQNNIFDMSYIMNQMGDEPIMTAENPQQHEHYQEIYDRLAEVYRPQIEAQFQEQFLEIARQQVTLGAYQNAIKQILTSQGMSEEEADQYLTDNEKAISTDPHAFIAENLGGEDVANSVDAKVNEYLESEEGQAVINAAYTQIMDSPIPDLNNMTPNQAIEVYVDQAAAGLTEGILGYWEGNHIGALAEGKSVCMGYAKAFAYLVQCMYPEYYGVNGAGTDMTVASNWKTAKDLYYDADGNLDINADYNVDLVRITFQANVTMYGEPQPDFNSDHFWNAVKIDGKWYYVDPCYTDVFSEVMNRDRVETDGYMNHTYFMISHTSIAEMFDGNYKEIKTLYADAATNTDYEGSWVSRVVSNVYSDGTYIYYMYDSTDMLDLMRQFNSSDGNYQNMDIEDAVYKIVRHKMSDSDLGDGDTNYETLIDFNSGDSVTVLNPSTGEMEENEMLTELFAQFEEEQTVYPAIHTTPVLYNGKLYFNVSNSILSYDLSSGEVAEVKEYNTVNAVRDDSEVFGAMAFDVTSSADGADFTFENHPIAGMTLKNDGKLYVDIATNLSYIAGRDPHDYTDASSYGYEFEESNYNPNYNEYASQMMDDEGISDDMLEQLGYKREINDNSEFMWVANAVDTVDMAHLGGTSHDYSAVTVAPYCDRDGFTENRCTTCGAIEADSRTVDEGSACDGHHYVLFHEEYYTKDANEQWNEGDTYVCTRCGFSISEPTEPKENSFVTGDDYEEQVAEYEKNKAIYDEAVATAGHTYTASDAQWSEDYTTVTFQNLTCSAGCAEKQHALDCLLNDTTISAALESPVTANTKITNAEGTCAEGVTTTYEASAEVDGQKYTVSTTKTWEAGDHNYVNGKCTKCGEADPDALVAPEIESVYSKLQTTAKVTWTPVENAVGYQLYRAESADAADADWTLTKTITGENIDQYTKDDTIQYTNVDLTVGTTYYYKVRAFALVSGAADASDEASRIYSPFSDVKYMPAAVVFGDVYSAATDKVRLNWNEVKGAHGYQIWCKAEDEDEFSIVKTLGDRGNELTNNQGATTAYSKYELEAGKTYTFKMRAFMIPGDGTKVFGAYSDEVTVAVMPENTKITVSSTKAGKADVTWNTVAGADGYQIWMQEGSGEYKIVKTVENGSTKSYTKSSLTSGATYKFKVRAYTEAGGKKTFGAYSNEASVKVK